MTRPGVAILGGTFDPIHYGHLAVASYIHAQLPVDRVLLVPSGQSWLKVDRPTGTTAQQRFEMCLLASISDARLTVSRVDIDRPGPTYTEDTLADLQQEYPQREFYFVLGADIWQQFERWRNPDAIREQCQLVAVTRAGESAEVPEYFAAQVVVPDLAISSTVLRARVAAREPIEYLTPQPVIDYIDRENLYAGQRSRIQ